MYLVKRDNNMKKANTHEDIKDKNKYEIIQGVDKKGNILDIFILNKKISEENYFIIKSSTFKYELNIDNIYEVTLYNDICSCLLILKFDSIISDTVFKKLNLKLKILKILIFLKNILTIILIISGLI